MVAPDGAVGRTQIIPNSGPHTQIYVEDNVAKFLALVGDISYDPDYGPGARVYRPTRELTTAEVIRSWL